MSPVNHVAGLTGLHQDQLVDTISSRVISTLIALWNCSAFHIWSVLKCSVVTVY